MAAKILKSYCSSTILLSTILIFTFLGTCECARPYWRVVQYSEKIKDSISDINANCWRRLEEIEYIKQLNVNKAPFEVGYLMQIVQDKYRKMVDKYNVTIKLDKTNYLFEIIIYLEEIEHGYWQIEHLASQNTNSPIIKPLNETILENAPWTIKLLMLKEMDPPTSTTVDSYRRVGMESLVARRQDSAPGIASPVAASVNPETDDDENNMRLKLFRLMYETVRDSDLKVKRAELIRKHYVNSSAFEVGFLMGEVQEKFDIINEFSGTLQKFYDVWKPIEHINAYEQIANYAIQVNHLIDLVRTIGKNST